MSLTPERSEATANGALTAGKIFRHKPPAPTRVEVPELGGYTFVRVLTAGERARLESDVQKAREAGASIHALAVVACCCDEEGKLLFEDGAAGDLASADSRVVVRIGEAAAEVNRLRPSDREEVEKNSATPPSSASSGGSP